MATNETFRAADFLSLPVPSGTKAGDPLRIGGLNVVAVTDRANTSVSPTNDNGTTNASYNWGGGNPDGNASCWLVGAHDFTVDFAVASVGTPIYIDDSGDLTTDADDGGSPATAYDLYGHALSTKASTAGPLTVRIAN